MVFLGAQENILTSLKIITQNMGFLGLDTMFSFLIQLGYIHRYTQMVINIIFNIFAWREEPWPLQ